MPSRDHTFAVAFAISIVTHVGIVLVLADGYVRGVARDRSVANVAVALRQSSEMIFGDDLGGGDAANRSPGDLPMLSRDNAPEQALLSRDPAGAGHIGDAPSMSVLPQGESAPSPPQPLAAQSLSVPIGIADRSESWSSPRMHAASAAPQAPSVPDQPQAASPAPPADPAAMSDAESDAFGHGESVVFQDGRVDARLGRKVKTVRPRLSYTSQIDLFSQQFPNMVVRIRIDAAGAVRRVDIVKSSRSVSADQEVKVALYQWWFEPKKKSDDVVQFPIVWR